jgi:hypothetical protein
MDRLKASFAEEPQPAPVEVSHAFWSACHGSQRPAAEYLLDRGADLNLVPRWANMTPLDIARQQKADDLVAWLVSRGAKSAKDIA